MVASYIHPRIVVSVYRCEACGREFGQKRKVLAHLQRLHKLREEHAELAWTRRMLDELAERRDNDLELLHG